MSVVVKSSARETIAPGELTDVFEDFIERGPQYLDAKTGTKASAYRFGKRVFIAYEEGSETGLVILYSPNLVEEKVFQKSAIVHPG